MAKSPDKELREQITPFCEEPVDKGTLPLDTALCQAHGLKSAGKSVVWIIAPLATSTECPCSVHNYTWRSVNSSFDYST